MHMCSVTRLCPTLCNPMDCLSVGLSRQEYWSGLPFPPPGHLHNPGIKPMPPALAGRIFTTEPPGKHCMCKKSLYMYVEHIGVWFAIIKCFWNYKQLWWHSGKDRLRSLDNLGSNTGPLTCCLTLPSLIFLILMLSGFSLMTNVRHLIRL